jgi:peptidoglycan/xylan/chitin deacetylase (PgdA/CDA1 family)
MAQPGVFTVSLDFELYWGVRDTLPLDRYRGNILGAREAIPRILEAFARCGAHATWAAVGFLFFDRKEELLASLPEERPAYTRAELSPYPYLHTIGATERADPCHFGRSLLRAIAAHPGQEIGTHTFSHYYCLEPGQTARAFKADLDAAVAAAAGLGVELRSLVFPKNQCNPAYLGLCRAAGLVAYRGVEASWMYQPEADDRKRPLKRLARLLDQYASLSGLNLHELPAATAAEPVDVPASRFLRPATPGWSRLEPLRLRRIRTAMTEAAREGKIFHLWWHPHNFGAHTDLNLALLDRVLAHFRVLADRYGMVSRNMAEIAADRAAPSRHPPSG